MSYSQYTSSARIDRLLSTYGTTNFADYDGDGSKDTDVITDVIDEASGEVAAYVLEKYTDTQAAASSLVTRWTTVLAARFLCLRRGNMPPESLEMEFHRLVNPDDGLLVRVRRGQLKLPDADRDNRGFPTMSNLKVDRRYPHEKVRVVERTSDRIATSLERDALGTVVYD
jgi:phage gp36-like protein